MNPVVRIFFLDFARSAFRTLAAGEDGDMTHGDGAGGRLRGEFEHVRAISDAGVELCVDEEALPSGNGVCLRRRRRRSSLEKERLGLNLFGVVDGVEAEVLLELGAEGFALCEIGRGCLDAHTGDSRIGVDYNLDRSEKLFLYAWRKRTLGRLCGRVEEAGIIRVPMLESVTRLGDGEWPEVGGLVDCVVRFLVIPSRTSLDYAESC